MLTPLRSDPGYRFEAVTPSADPIPPTRGIYVGGAGNLVIRSDNGDETTFTNIAPGVVHPIRCVGVLAATTATGIVAVR
jgi:hypothetical protein